MRPRFTLPALTAAIALALLGCASTVDQANNVETPAVTPQPGETETPTSTSAPEPDETTKLSPVDAYLSWLAASREPNAPLACELMTDELQSRMLAEFTQTLGTTFPDCESMITATAAMYAATGTSADVDVKVVTETASEAALFATYAGSGKCGTIHLTASNDGWTMTAQSEGCAN